MKIAIDFDDTIAVKNPDGSIGEPIGDILELVKDLKAKGHQVFIFSGRENEEIDAWLKERGIVPDGYISIDEAYKKDWEILIDDRAVNPTGKNKEIILKQIEMIAQREIPKEASVVKSPEQRETKGSFDLLKEVLERREKLEEEEIEIDSELRKKILSDVRINIIENLLKR